MSDPNRPLLSDQVKGGLCQVTQQIGNMKRSDTDNNSKATNLKYSKCKNTKWAFWPFAWDDAVSSQINGDHNLDALSVPKIATLGRGKWPSPENIKQHRRGWPSSRLIIHRRRVIVLLRSMANNWQLIYPLLRPPEVTSRVVLVEYLGPTHAVDKRKTK